MAIKANVQKKRRAIRFAPDPGTLAEIAFELEKIHVYGLVVNESSGGCAVLVSTEETIEKGMICICRVGNLDQVEADVRWIKELEPNLYKIGLNYHIPSPRW